MKKTTSNELSKKLTRYSALSLALAGLAEVNGQIVHHPVEPDIVGSGEYFLNLNPIDGITPGSVADSIDDFRIFSASGSYGSGPFLKMGIERIGSNNSIIGSSSIFVYPYALNSGYTISAGNTNWKNVANQSLAFSFTTNPSNYGNWISETDKYLGLKFDIGANTHFGWVKLDIELSTLSWTVKEYAFNMTPDEAIDAGQTTLGLDDTFFDRVKIIALNKTIALYNLPDHTNYKVFNMSGQHILDGKTQNKTHIIEANSLANGIYIIELKDNNTKALLRKKIVL